MIKIKEIKLIIWDLDETLWKGTISEEHVHLNSMFVDFIRNSMDMGIVHSICSKNDLEQVKRALSEMGIWNCFVFPSVDWTPKGARIREIITKMNLRAVNVLFVDDNIQNLKEAKFYCEGILTAVPGEILNLCEQAQKAPKTDTEHKRLKQYKILEEKDIRKVQFNSNTDFLMSCNIIVNICENCLPQIDRLHELLMRSNQLNYTKFRQEKAELISLLQQENVKSGYVKVRDNFGDYGIVGFYAIQNGRAIHFLFSCRTLGMLVEQYTYMKLGCPDLEVVGEVVTKLNKQDMPPWINQNSGAKKMQAPAAVTSRILFKGPCDMMQMFSFIQENENVMTEFTYTNDRGICIEGHNHTGQTVTSLYLDEKEKNRLIQEFDWFDEKMLSTRLETQAFDVVVYSLLNDGNLGLYRKKENGAFIALCEKAYDLTSPKNWDAYVKERVFTSNIKFRLEDLRRFGRSYEYVPNEDGSVTIENLDKIYAKIKTKKIVLLLGSEQEYSGRISENYVNRHLYHQKLNRKVRKWAQQKENVVLLPLDKYIRSRHDLVDSINHLSKSAYYHLAQDLVSIIEEQGTALQMEGKKALIYQTMRQKARIMKERLFRRG